MLSDFVPAALLYQRQRLDVATGIARLFIVDGERIASLVCDLAVGRLEHARDTKRPSGRRGDVYPFIERTKRDAFRISRRGGGRTGQRNAECRPRCRQLANEGADVDVGHGRRKDARWVVTGHLASGRCGGLATHEILDVEGESTTAPFRRIGQMQDDIVDGVGERLALRRISRQRQCPIGYRTGAFEMRIATVLLVFILQHDGFHHAGLFQRA